MFPGWLQIAVVVLLILLFFGRGKISQLMGDLGKGLRTFRKGLEDDDEVKAKTQTKKSTQIKSSSKKAPSRNKKG